MKKEMQRSRRPCLDCHEERICTQMVLPRPSTKLAWV
ncbi:mCG65746 [Mus musculus]|nr:mCG65746 [Mus musculus]